jgi:hypothetical protein
MKDWAETSWTFEDGMIVTISEVLQRSANIDAIDIPIEDIQAIRTVQDLDPGRVEQADISYPILVVDNCIETYILDGNHRLQKAINNNQKTIKVKTLRGII